MLFYLGVFIFFLLLVWIVASSSIGIECYNKEQSLKTEKKGNFNFLIAGTIVPFVGMAGFVGYLYMLGM